MLHHLNLPLKALVLPLNSQGINIEVEAFENPLQWLQIYRLYRLSHQSGSETARLLMQNILQYDGVFW